MDLSLYEYESWLSYRGLLSSGVLESPELFLSCPKISLAQIIANILISTLKTSLSYRQKAGNPSAKQCLREVSRGDKRDCGPINIGKVYDGQVPVSGRSI